MTNARLPLPVLMLVTDRHVAGGEDALVEKIAEAVAGGVNVVQMRERDLAHDDLMSLTKRTQEAIAGQALLLINRAPSTALTAHADGVHLPEDAELPSGWPHSLLIGRSVHSLESARRASAEGTDYLIFGSVYETESHADAPAVGPAVLREIKEAVSVPVIAIGGIKAESVGKLIEAGASGVAVIRAILAASDPRAAAQELRDALEAAGAAA